MGPAALILILFLRHFGLVAREPVWMWIAVFVATPLVTATTEFFYSRRPTPVRLNLRVASHAGAVTAVIYLSGWGPVLVCAYAFVALENVSHDGSRTWRLTAMWSVIGIALGQLAIWRGWMPSFLSVSKGAALSLMGAFVLLFMIRMAGITIGEKEDAESSLATSEDRFRSLVQKSSDTTLVTDDTWLISDASPAVVDLLGLEPEAVLGRSLVSLVHGDDRSLLEVKLSAQLMLGDGSDCVEFRMGHADGTWRHVEAIVTDLRDRPSVAGFVVNVRDITDRKEAETQLAHQALHDPLTGLPNRTLILDRATQMLARSRRENLSVAALFIDLDNFKDINDSLGHEAGDRLLQTVTQRFEAMLRASDTVGRLGGDEFVVLTESLPLAPGPELVAERIRLALRQPFHLEGYDQTPIVVSASIGIATGARASAHELLRDADIALYRAKAMGKDRWTMFEPAMQSAVLDRLELEMDLRSALEHKEFLLLYQPVFDLDNVRACGVEALLRWHHPTRGVLAPDEFIPSLEETGLIVDVGRWVLTEACGQAATWHQQGHPLTMSVNVSMRQLEVDAFVDHVRDALSVSGIDPGSLILEVTETTLMRDTHATVGRLRALKALGVLIAIDDFGTGYSSLAYLRQFPVDALKIDRSFVAAMGDSQESVALVQTLVQLGRALGIETLAEGIEEQWQLQRLQGESCERGQGFLFSRPVDPEAIEVLLSGGTTPLEPANAPGPVDRD